MTDHVLLISEARIATVQLLERILLHLQETTSLSVTSRLLSDVTPDDISLGTFPVLVRSCSPEAERLVRAIRRGGGEYAFYLDDNFWLLDPETELGRHYASRPTRRRLDSIVRHASPVIASTPLLSSWLAARAGRVTQLDSFFDYGLVPPSLPARPVRAEVRVGFAASAYRGDDLALVVPELLTVLDQYPHLTLEIIGADAEIEFQHPRVVRFPYQQSYEQYLAFQLERQWDIGLAPLGSVASNQYKTDNKYREYAALGIAGVYQDAAPYAAVRDGVTGLLATDARSWGDALRRYLDEPALIDRVRAAADADARGRVSLEAVSPQWEAFFTAAPAFEAVVAERVRRELDPPQSAFQRAVLRLRLLWAHGVTQLAEHGFWPTARRTVVFVLRGGARPPSDGAT